MMDQATRSYEQSIRSLQAASAGRFPGAAIPTNELRQAAGTLTGLDTSVLRREAHAARGTSTPASTQKWWSVVMPILQSIAGGMIAEGISHTIKNWLQRVDDATSTDQAAQDCADSIDAVVDSADAASAALGERLSESIASICQALEMINPREQQALAQQLVMMGTGLINTVGQQLVGMCADRDHAVGRCLDDLITHASSLCDAAAQESVPQTAVQALESCTPESGAPTAPAPQPAAPSEPTPSGAAHSTPSPPAATPPPAEGASPAAPPSSAATPASTTPQTSTTPPASTTPSTSAGSECPPAPPGETVGETRVAQVGGAAGAMGGIGTVQASGMGMVSAAGALLADVAAHATAQVIGGVEMGINAALSLDTQCPPASPAPESCPPQPCSPESSALESAPQVTDLSTVPEPEPPAEKVRMMAEQQAAAESQPAPNQPGEAAPEPSTEMPKQDTTPKQDTPAAESSAAESPAADTPGITARKAGVW